MGRRLAALVLIGLAALAASARPAVSDTPRVTVIGDSVLTGVQYNPTPLAILQNGIDAWLEIGVCRTIEGESCPFEGRRVPTLVEVVRDLGADLAKTVVVEVGYNDPASTFANEVDDAMRELVAAGVTRVYWLTLRVIPARRQYAGMNQALAAAATRYPQLTLVDWNGYAYGHDTWFQNDDLHLVEPGAEAMATLLHDTIANGAPPPIAPAPPLPPPDPPIVLPSTPLPVAHVGKPYAAKLVAKGGTPPFRWRTTSGPLPAGLHLLADGRITGKPRRAAHARLVLRARDAVNESATRAATLVITHEHAPDDG